MCRSRSRRGVVVRGKVGGEAGVESDGGSGGDAEGEDGGKARECGDEEGKRAVSAMLVARMAGCGSRESGGDDAKAGSGLPDHGVLRR